MAGIPRLSDLRVRAQLAAGFGAMVLLVALSGVLVWTGTHHGAVSADTARAYNAGALALGDARAGLGALRAALAEFATADEAGRRALREDDPGAVAAVEQALHAYAATGPGPEQAKLLHAAQAAVHEQAAARPRWFELQAAGRTQEASDWQHARLAPSAAAAAQALAELSRLQQAASIENHRAETEVLVNARAASLLLGAVALGLALLLAWRITASVARPIQQAVAAARRIADGDLSVQLQARGRSETGELLRALATMAASLRELVAQVASGARSVAGASSQIAQGNQELSRRTEEQAGTLEETASAMEELTTTVSQNAEHALQVNALAAGASEVARKGGQAVGDVVRTMDGISAASRRISDIIGVIDGIAFQTNILALNAAVEAARAGDQGRGFAVVAGEVRSLAQRSATAAREIKALIVDSAGQVEAGSRLVDAAGRTMEEIVASVQQVTGLVAHIAAASREQGSGIEQVHLAVAQMDRMVQQNASLAEEATAAAEAMKEEAAALLRLVGRFRLVGEPGTRQGPGGEAAAPSALAAAPPAVLPGRAGLAAIPLAR